MKQRPSIDMDGKRGRWYGIERLKCADVMIQQEIVESSRFLTLLLLEVAIRSTSRLCSNAKCSLLNFNSACTSGPHRTGRRLIPMFNPHFPCSSNRLHSAGTRS